MSRKQYAIILAGLLLTGGLVLAGLWLKPRLAVGRIRTDGITSYPRQIQEHLEAARTLVTVVVRGEKDETMQRHLAGDTRTGRIIESYHSGSRFVLKPGEGHHGVGKYWQENLQYVLQFRRNDTSR